MCINVEVIDVDGSSLPKTKYDMEDKLKHIDPEDIIKIINVNNNHTTPPQTRIIVFKILWYSNKQRNHQSSSNILITLITILVF